LNQCYTENVKRAQRVEARHGLKHTRRLWNQKKHSRQVSNIAQKFI